MIKDKQRNHFVEACGVCLFASSGPDRLGVPASRRTHFEAVRTDPDSPTLDQGIAPGPSWMRTLLLCRGFFSHYCEKTSLESVRTQLFLSVSLETELTYCTMSKCHFLSLSIITA